MISFAPFSISITFAALSRRENDILRERYSFFSAKVHASG